MKLPRYCHTALMIPALAALALSLAFHSAQAISPGTDPADVIFIDAFETAAPQIIGYPSSSYEFLVGSPITPKIPLVIGGATSFAISPSLPAGINFSTSTGSISGTPSAASPTANYMVTATNAEGSDDTSISIKVTASFVYDGSPYTLYRNEAVTPIGPTSPGGFSGFSIDPVLPTGLDIDGASGVISGTPTSNSTQTMYTVTGSDVNGPAQATFQLRVIDPSPSNLSYANSPFIFEVGTPIATQSPTVTGIVTGYAINPALAAGLSFNTSTGEISGTPSMASPTTMHTVTASNATGSANTNISVTVSGSFVYVGSPFTFQRGVEITPIGPTGTGGFFGFSVLPALPDGLSIDSGTGVISGTSTVTSALQIYDINGSDAGGTSSTAIQIEVIEPAPTNLSYANAPFVFQQSTPITPQTPTVSGVVSSFSINPSLPTGLSFSTSTGQISGTPAATSPTTNYTVTASNSTGSTQTVIAITINGVLDCDGAALGGACWFFGQNNQDCDTVCSSHGGYSEITRTFAGSGGNNTNCGNVMTAIGAASPTPVTTAANIDGIDGLGCASDYSGTATTYRFTSTTTSGASSVSSSLSIRRACACNDQPPPNSVFYTNAPFSFTQGVMITPQTPTTSGFVSSFNISPSLPAGLSFDTNTGEISGTPTVVSATAAFTVTASNAGGSVQTVFNLTVNGAPPSGLSYAGAPYLFNVGASISPQTPTVTGSVTSYGINPALPTGLNFSSTTGTISGTPSVVSAATNYTVTASNAYGSTNTVISIQVQASSACDGNLVGGFCWWLGANTQSCTTVCAEHGGYNSGTQSYAGSSGTDQHCADVATALASQGLANPTPVTAAANIDSVSGLGCASDYDGAATTYRVTSTTTAGALETNTRRMCACNDQPAPVSISYSGTPYSFPKNVAITAKTPTVNGYVKTFGISPSLPAGLSFNTSTGVISGTPTTASGSTLYTVTGSNSAGSVQTSFNLSVFVQAPSNLQYPLSAYVFNQNESITPQVPTYSGSNAISFGISASLPTGLSFNTANGTISGTPTVVSAASNRTITATNSAGSTNVVISIQVTAPASCAGDSIGGFCWYFGQNNESCDTVCTGHGGYSAGTQSFAGSGGSNGNCKTVLTAIGAANAASQTPINVTSLGGISGLGCGSDYSDLATAYRLTSTTTSSASSAGNGSLYFRRACACSN